MRGPRSNEDKHPVDDGPSAPSTDEVQSEPAEVESVRAQLAAIPQEWLDQDTVEGYVNHAAAQASLRSVSEVAALAEQCRDSWIAELAAGNPVAELLVDAVGRAAAARAAANMLTVPDVPFETGANCIAHAAAALAAAGDALLQIEALDSTAALARYHQALVAGRPGDPPIYLPAERALGLKAEQAQRKLQQWRQLRVEWREIADNRNARVLDLLGSAVGLRKQLEPIVAEINEVNEQIRAVNADRRRLG